MAANDAAQAGSSPLDVSRGTLFATYVANQLPLIEQSVLERTPHPLQDVAHEQAPHEFHDLHAYLYEPLRRFVAQGGKRIRPALCLLGAEAVGADPATALSVAAAVELFQAAALIHDDIADKSELRRSNPCLHITEGTGLAINAGDAALVAVTTSIARDASLPPDTRLHLIEETCAMEERTLEGQALDLGWARDGRWDLSVEDYLYMARHKTAYYSAAVPLAMGAICGGGSSEQVEALRRFGMDCGLAFQIQDDLLNLVGDAAKQGKDFRSDITEGKRTLVMMYALEHLGQTQRNELVAVLSSATTEPAELARAVRLANEAGALTYAHDYALTLVRHAKDALDTMDVAEKPRAVLRSMADFFVERNS